MEKITQNPSKNSNTIRQTTKKLSLSSQLSSEALIAHPTPEQPPYPTTLKSQPPTKPRRQTAHASRASISQKKPNQPHSAANSAQTIQLQTHSPSTQASSFPVKTLLKKCITGPNPKAVTSVPIPTTPPVR